MPYSTAMDASRVRVATCHDRAQAIAIREELEASAIDAVVTSESHAPPGLAGLATGYVACEVWGEAADAERAAGVLGEDTEEDAADHDHAPDHAHDPDHDQDSPKAIDAVVGLERRKRTGMAILLAFTITFGTGHLYTRAWMRGITLAAIEIVGFGQIWVNPTLAAVLVAGAIVSDAVGATMRIRAATAPAKSIAKLPAARVVDR